MRWTRPAPPGGGPPCPTPIGSRRRGTRRARTGSGFAPQLPGPLVGEQGVHQLVQLPHQHLVQLVEGEADAMVGHPVLLEVVRPDLLGPTATTDLAPPGLAQLGRLAILFGLEEAGPEDLHGLGPVLDLALLVLHGP